MNLNEAAIQSVFDWECSSSDVKVVLLVLASQTDSSGFGEITFDDLVTWTSLNLTHALMEIECLEELNQVVTVLEKQDGVIKFKIHWEG